MTYSIDTSALLDGWVRYYPPDVFPPLWDTNFDLLIETGELIASKEVLVELEKKDDDVFEWASDRKQMFVPIDDKIQPLVSNIMATYQRLVDTRKARSAADPFIIALAQRRSCTVVTGELPTNNLNKPNIPDVCGDMGIRCINLLQLFRDQGWTFSSHAPY